MNLEQPELTVGHATCSCSFCKINKVNQQSIRRFIFGRQEFKSSVWVRTREGLSIAEPVAEPVAKKSAHKNHWKINLQQELPDLAELDKKLA